jgi:hypothetical protein
MATLTIVDVPHHHHSGRPLFSSSSTSWSELARRGWAGDHPGVILVFVIVFLVVLGLLLLVLYRRWLRRSAEKQALTE